jgi:hypothetical protein
MGMKGWVTWTSVAGFVLLALVDFYNGNIEGGITKITAATGFLGIGRKADKAAEACAPAT